MTALMRLATMMPLGVSFRCASSKNSLGGQMKRHGVRIIGVDQDDVVLIRRAGQKEPSVLGVESKIFAFADVEMSFGDLDHFRVDFDHVDLQWTEIPFAVSSGSSRRRGR